MAADRPLLICTLKFFLVAPPVNSTATVLLVERTDSQPDYESKDQSRDTNPSQFDLRGVGVDVPTPAHE